MPQEIESQEYLSIGESVEYTGWSRTALNLNIPKYEERTGKTVAKIKDGQKSFIKKEDLDAMLVVLKPLEARRRGLIK